MAGGGVWVVKHTCSGSRHAGDLTTGKTCLRLDVGTETNFLLFAATRVPNVNGLVRAFLFSVSVVEFSTACSHHRDIVEIVPPSFALSSKVLLTQLVTRQQYVTSKSHLANMAPSKDANVIVVNYDDLKTWIKTSHNSSSTPTARAVSGSWQ